jgi:predicted dehydrogenase
LFDTGAHTLDSLIFLLGDFAELEYFDDAEGGVDANCLINLRLRNGASGVVELSRTRRLRNTAIVRGERGVVELPFGSSNLKLSLQNQPYVLDGSVGSGVAEADQPQDYRQLMTAQLEDFINAIRTGRLPAADGRMGKSSIALFETCYRQRKPLVLPWEHALGATG